MFTLKKLLKRMNKEKLEIHSIAEKAISYNMINPIFKSLPLQNNTLYICLVSELNNTYLQNSNIGFILIPDIPFKSDIHILCELVLWDEIVPFETLFATIQMEFRKVIDIAANTSSILSALIKGNSLNELLEIGSKILGNPLIITNTSYKVMAMSDVDIDEPTWKFARKYGYCSQESINRFKWEGIAKKTIESENPIVLNDDFAKGFPRIVKRIVIKNKSVGYLGLYEVNNKFKQSDLDAINIFCDIISVEMKNSIHEENFTYMAYESIIIDLLNNEIPTTNILQSRLKAANWFLKENFSLIKIPLFKSDQSIWFFDYFYAKLIKHTTLSKFAKYHSSLVAIINYDTKEEYEQEINNIINILKHNKIEGGASNVFNELELKYLNSYYHQASKAYEIGKLTNKSSAHLYHYEDIDLFHFFSKIQNKNDLRMFCHPAYNKLLEHDKLNGTEYCKSLYEYILCANNISASAEKLFIHRNTMSYRINKISEITGLDLTNGKDIYKLYMAIKINKWLEF